MELAWLEPATCWAAIRINGGLPAQTRLAQAVSWKTGVLSSGVDTGGLFGLMESRERVFYETVVD
ncbi:MAG: hypothetical protein M3P18_08935 [Actinomycetota bacterium]|nr:hypothetical protein [Actinomycetota bacterium]